jgi:hypothetical protein
VLSLLSRYHHQHPEVDQLGHFIAHLVNQDTVDAYVFTEVFQDAAGILSLLEKEQAGGPI